MAIVEVVIFLITPALEILLPFAFLVLEAIFWLCVALISLLKGIFTLSKPNVPKWKSFTTVRGKIASTASRWRVYKDKRASKKGKNS